MKDFFVSTFWKAMALKGYVPFGDIYLRGTTGSSVRFVKSKVKNADFLIGIKNKGPLSENNLDWISAEMMLEESLYSILEVDEEKSCEIASFPMNFDEFIFAMNKLGIIKKLNVTA